MNKNKFVNLGILCTAKEPNEDGSKRYYIKLDKDIQVNIDGDNVTGGYLNVNDPLEKFDRMAAKAERDLSEGKINEEKYDEIIEKAGSQSKRFLDGGDLSFISKELTYVRKN